MFSIGDTVTITRGKAKGQATIMAAAEDGQYAVKTTDGKLAVVNADSIKAPVESTIGEGRLAAEIQTLAGDLKYGGHDVDTQLQALVSRLSVEMPGLGARIFWPAESADEIQPG